MTVFATWDIEKLNNTSDGAIVNFLIRSTYHYYVKRLQKERDRKVPEVYCQGRMFRLRISLTDYHSGQRYALVCLNRHKQA